MGKGNNSKVACYLKKFMVNLVEKNCSCNFWSLTGMPCRHTYACLFFIGNEPHNYMSHYYLVESYKTCYAVVVNLINGENLWSQ